MKFLLSLSGVSFEYFCNRMMNKCDLVISCSFVLSEVPFIQSRQTQHQQKLVEPEIFMNKKVLLRERKRHTARHVASTRYAALSNPDLPPPPSRPGRGGTPSRLGQEGRTPGIPHHPDLVRGYPGYPLNIQTWSGGYPIQTWSGGTPCPQTGMGYPPPEMGYP